MRDAAKLLGETLQEEKRTDELLTQLAEEFTHERRSRVIARALAKAPRMHHHVSSHRQALPVKSMAAQLRDLVLGLALVRLARFAYVPAEAE